MSREGYNYARTNRQQARRAIPSGEDGTPPKRPDVRLIIGEKCEFDHPCKMDSTTSTAVKDANPVSPSVTAVELALSRNGRC